MVALNGGTLGAEIGTQLVTVGATLSGVVLTLVTNAYLERRRVQDTRELESLRLESEQAKWLRDERVKAYANLSTACAEIQQFIRFELPTLIEPGRAGQRAGVEARWGELRAELRKAYDQVALFGTDGARDAGLLIWRTARNGGQAFLSALDATPGTDLAEQLRETASRLGTAGNDFLDACRRDLQP